MSDLPQIGDIQIHEDLPFLRREWRVQRIGWIALGIIVVLALLGVFGRGPVAKDLAGDPNTFGVEFDRVIRHGSDAEVTIRVGPGLQSQPVLRIFISRAYLDSFDIYDIVPAPVASGVSGELIFYDFVRENVRTPARFSLHVRPTGYWHHTARVGLVGATSVAFSQLILP